MPMTQRAKHALAVAVLLGRIAERDLREWFYAGESAKGYGFRNARTGKWLFV